MSIAFDMPWCCFKFDVTKFPAVRASIDLSRPYLLCSLGFVRFDKTYVVAIIRVCLQAGANAAIVRNTRACGHLLLCGHHGEAGSRSRTEHSSELRQGCERYRQATARSSGRGTVPQAQLDITAAVLVHGANREVRVQLTVC